MPSGPWRSCPCPHPISRPGGAGSHRAAKGEGPRTEHPSRRSPPEPSTRRRAGPSQRLGGALLELALRGVPGRRGRASRAGGSQQLSSESHNFHFPWPHLRGLPWLGQSEGGRRTVPLWEDSLASASGAEQSHQEVHRRPSQRLPPSGRRTYRLENHLPPGESASSHAGAPSRTLR